MSNISIYDLAGKRIRLIEMIGDPDPITPGSEGIVVSGGFDVLTVKWDNGRILGVIDGVDKYEIID
jgi:hypothetical protein